jgi:hypothetical protein
MVDNQRSDDPHNAIALLLNTQEPLLCFMLCARFSRLAFAPAGAAAP